VTNSAAYGWDAYEVSGLGSHPTTRVESGNTGASGTNYDSGAIFPNVNNALVIGEAYAGAGFSSIPGAPWVTNTEINRIAGYQLQTKAGQGYSWSGALGSNGSWVSGVASISANPAVRRGRRSS
jgi:hypothetical protein